MFYFLGLASSLKGERIYFLQCYSLWEVFEATLFLPSLNDFSVFYVIKVFGFTVCKDYLVVDIIYRGDISFNVYDQITS